MGGDNDWDRTPFEVNRGANSLQTDGAKDFCEVISVSEASASAGFINDTWFAFASGEASCLNMSVQLVPMIYIDKPDYWGIEVIGCLSGVCLTATRPYGVWSDITDVIGHKGIEIIGSNKSIKIDIAAS